MRFFARLFISPWLLCPLLALLLLGTSLIDQPTLLKLEYPVYDQLLKFRAPSQNNQVVLISIDQYSRSLLGDDLDSDSGLTSIIKKVRHLGGETIALLTPLGFTERKSDSTRALVDMLNVSSIVLALGNTDGELPPARKILTESLLPPSVNLPDPQQLLLSLQNPLAKYRLNRPDNATLVPPTVPGLDPTLRTGHLIFAPDPDGQIRSQALLIPWKNQLAPALPLQLLLAFQDENLQQPEDLPQQLDGQLLTAKTQIPVIGYSRMLLDLSGTGRSFTTYRAAELLQEKLQPGLLQNKVVLIGPTDSFGDRHQVAGQGNLSTTELAAQATATLLGGSAPRRPYWAWLGEAAAQLYFVILLLLLIPKLSFRAGATTLLLFAASWFLIAAGALILFGIWLKIAPGLLLCLAGFTLVRRHISKQDNSRREQENNMILAQRFQEQGLLDLALEKALLFEAKDKSGKEMLYNLGIEFERKRLPNKAIAVYQRLLQAGRFRDTRTRLKQLQKHDRTVILSSNNNATVALDRPGEKPTLGRYRIERELGQGAMGTVYLGIDPKINRHVAIKTLAYQLLDPEELPRVKERFFREAETAGRLSHPNIVTIYDVGEETDLAFLAMELLEGENLSHYCRSKQKLPVAQVIGILAQAANALDYAHRQGVVHRDIKPVNMILLLQGQLKIADFGIARVVSSSQTETGIILGTPGYMWPEQVAGKKVDGRSDQFSLGIGVYE